jgi:hypothetical protein
MGLTEENIKLYVDEKNLLFSRVYENIVNKRNRILSGSKLHTLRFYQDLKKILQELDKVNITKLLPRVKLGKTQHRLVVC